MGRSPLRSIYGNSLVLSGRGDACVLRGAGWFRSRCGHRAFVRRAIGWGTAAGARFHRSGVGRERGVACGGGRHVILRFPGALCLELQRILSAAHNGPVAADFARHCHRAAQPCDRRPLEIVLGCRVRRREHFACDLLRCRAGECRSGRSPGSGGLFLSSALDQLPAGQRRRHSRLVHCGDRCCCRAYADGARLAVGCLQEYRGCAAAVQTYCAPDVVGRGGVHPCGHGL